MLKKLLNSTSVKKYKHQAHQILHRSLNQHITLAVTGFSRSGKTAFITSLVNQLTAQTDKQNLPFFNVVQNGKLIAAKVIPQDALNIPTFPYSSSIDTILANNADTQPDWPASTERINTLRLAIKFQPEQGVRGQFADSSTLIVDLIDYPGEWLMDLPMLDLNYFQWSEQQFRLLTTEPRCTFAHEYLVDLSRLDLDAPVDEAVLETLAKSYQALLKRFKQELKLTILQPGRMLIPGDLAGAPLLSFIPLNLSKDHQVIAGSNLEHLIKRYKAYIKEVITPFYQNYFSHFDRQIVLVDLLTALGQGPNVLKEQSEAIRQLLKHFNYGQSNFLKRLFSPKIDKLLFAANKSDHLSPEHHKDLALLLNNIVHSSLNELKFEGVKVDTMAMSSICATKAVIVKDNNEQLSCIQGREIKSNKWLTYLPAQPPMRLINEKEWPKQGFSFPEFYPLPTADKKLNHIRMDHVLEFLLGDKLI